MKARIHFTTKDGQQDYIVLTGTLKELQERAPKEVEKRGGVSPWSEVIEE